jgi:hypothetical protein
MISALDGGGWSTSRSGHFYPRERTDAHFTGDWVAPGPFWLGAKKLAPTGIRSPELPARSEPLYGLSYTGTPRCDVLSVYTEILSKYLVNKANLVHNFFLVCLFLIASFFGRLCAHHQEKWLYLCDTCYLSLCMDDCLVCRRMPAYQTVCTKLALITRLCKHGLSTKHKRHKINPHTHSVNVRANQDT